ncbi:E3 ubiquitin-protein ligase PDZRN3-B-like isoform X2 [Dendronephthya gigantea]|uniref:E3 ubiquitin-protein ligase PDZRN3-B-like isoform X2 n=1 Tax=Dendronephthya gigantea TaxID=151771 RepID=UPI00106C0B9C|nr:E3 ubiquitin-protein ligase PDZRN3-B-like isoform X2 [Dendronephthya gigantea]
MAEKWEEDFQGYDVNRFQEGVREDLLCSICQEVPKDPRLCQHKDHIFCFAHISRHLDCDLVQNSQTCPVCRYPLNEETLRRPTGFLKNYLDDLKIKCDNHDRGCPDYVRLENLPRHVKECGYAPAMCRNEGCETEINRRDIEAHEKDLCHYRIAKCHDCKDIKNNVNEIKASLDVTIDQMTAMKGRQDEMQRRGNEIKKNLDDLKARQDETNVQMSAMKINQNQIKRNHDDMKKYQDEMNTKLDEIKKNVDEIKKYQDQTNVQMTGMERNQDEMMCFY